MMRKLLFIAYAACLSVALLVSCDDETTNPVVDDKTNPVLSITQPLNNQEFMIGDNIAITANVSDEGSGVGSVEFFVDDSSVFIDAIAPYALYWDTHDAVPGTHKIKLIARDNNKNSVSGEITIELKQNAGYTEVFADELMGANGIAIDDNGYLYVSNSGSRTITRITSTGEKTIYANIDCPELNCITNTSDNCLLAACGTRVIKIDASGNKTELASGFLKAFDIVTDEAGNIYVLDAFANKIVKIAPNGTKTDFIREIAYQKGENKILISSMAFDKDQKNIYIAITIDNVIMRYPINEDGTPGNPKTHAILQNPRSLLFRDDGGLYATSRGGTSSLVKINGSNDITTVAQGKFSSPGCFVFGKGNFGSNYVYVADQGQNKVFRVFLGNSN